MTYDPWHDAGERYPQFHIERMPIAPYRALLLAEDRVIFVDSAAPRSRRACGLAHEIAHLDYRDQPVEDRFFSARQEAAADRLAAERLLTLGQLVDAHLWAHSTAEIADECGVDLETLTCRLDNLTLTEYNAIQEAISIRDFHEEGMT